MNPTWVVIGIVLIVLIAVVIFFQTAVKIVPEEKRLVVFRMGRSIGSRGPGLVTVIPFIDFVAWVEIQKSLRFNYKNLSTRDNRQTSLVVNLKGKIFDVEKSILNVPDLEKAISQLIEARVGDFATSKNSDELSSLSGQLEDELVDALRRSGRDWGFEVLKTQVNDIHIS